MTKAEKIRAMHCKHPKWSMQEIAKACGVRDSYARVVIRQRVLPGGRAPSDLNYDRKVRAKFGVSASTVRRWNKRAREAATA